MLFIAGLFEVAWAIALKYSDGFSRLWPSVVFGVTAWLSFACLAFALRSLPMGTSYAIWTGIGAVGIAVFGIIWLGEPANALRIGCILLIIIGIAGLKLSAGGAAG
jgi:quaternary ammonium compound-resistance protein SugE